MLGGIAHRFLKVILLQSLDVDYRAYLIAQPAIDAYVRINLRVPESFNISLERDGIVGTNIPTGITAAAIFLFFDADH
jgi:hypothetical protein